jgi:hydroxymethylglutaryl-CoA synthase
MSTGRVIGLLGYGAYVPEGRVPAKVLASAWGRSGEGRLPVKEKSVPGLDEDTITMAIEAARHALARAGDAVAPQRLGAAFVGSGIAEAALAIGMDAAQGKPGDHLEYTAAAGGGAVIVGPDSEQALARIDGSISYVTDTPDFFRRQHLHYPEHGHRFTGEPAYFRHVEEASKRLLQTLGRSPSDYRYAVFHQPNPKFVRKAAAALGFTEAQVGPTAVVDRIGNTYSGASLLGLAAALDLARPGDRIFLCSYGSGAGSDAFSFTVTDRIEAARGRAPLLKAHLDRRRPITDYGTYLRRAGAVRTL